jgi:hypothetical protein
LSVRTDQTWTRNSRASKDEYQVAEGERFKKIKEEARYMYSLIQAREKEEGARQA